MGPVRPFTRVLREASGVALDSGSILGLDPGEFGLGRGEAFAPAVKGGEVSRMALPGGPPDLLWLRLAHSYLGLSWTKGCVYEPFGQCRRCPKPANLSGRRQGQRMAGSQEGHGRAMGWPPGAMEWPSAAINNGIHEPFVTARRVRIGR